jgi:hypothetical protein
MAFYCIKQGFELDDYPGVTCNLWDKPPGVDNIKSEISGDTVKFETTGAEYSAIIAGATELDLASEDLITAPEKASVTDVIRAVVTKYTPDIGDPYYVCEYWLNRA